MPHGSLSCPQRDTCPAQMSAERVPQSVNVERPTTVVSFRDASGL
tara:strand:+ start:222 stop:356 length:135 start_codon:yes stop_codon:yes gene_type:complete